MGKKKNKTMKKNGDQQGFTLIEIMVSSAILLILVTSVFSILTSGSRLLTISNTQMELSASARNAMSRIFEELSLAGQDKVTVGGANDTITFQLADSYDSGAVTWGDQIRYSLGGLNGQQFLRTDLTTGDVQVWGNNISLLRFNIINGDTINIQMTLTKQSVKGDILTVPMSSQIRLRNQ